jgi:hypothetical protein
VYAEADEISKVAQKEARKSVESAMVVMLYRIYKDFEEKISADLRIQLQTVHTCHYGLITCHI